MNSNNHTWIFQIFISDRVYLYSQITRTLSGIIIVLFYKLVNIIKQTNMKQLPILYYLVPIWSNAIL